MASIDESGHQYSSSAGELSSPPSGEISEPGTPSGINLGIGAMHVSAGLALQQDQQQNQHEQRQHPAQPQHHQHHQPQPSGSASGPRYAIIDGKQVQLTAAGVPRKKPGRKPGTTILKVKAGNEQDDGAGAAKPRRQRKPRDPNAPPPVQRKRKVAPATNAEVGADSKSLAAAAAGSAAPSETAATAAAPPAALLPVLSHLHLHHLHHQTQAQNQREPHSQASYMEPSGMPSGRPAYQQQPDTYPQKALKREPLPGSMQSILNAEPDPLPLSVRPSGQRYDPIRGWDPVREMTVSRSSGSGSAYGAAPTGPLAINRASASPSIASLVEPHHPPHPLSALVSASHPVAAALPALAAPYQSPLPGPEPTTPMPPSPAQPGRRLAAAAALQSAAREPLPATAAASPSPPTALTITSGTSTPVALVVTSVPATSAAPTTPTALTAPTAPTAPSTPAPDLKKLAVHKTDARGKETAGSDPAPAKKASLKQKASSATAASSPNAATTTTAAATSTATAAATSSTASSSTASSSAAAAAATALEDGAQPQPGRSILDFGKVNPTDEHEAPTIVLEIPIVAGETNKYVNFMRMAEDQYGWDALHPRQAANRDRKARIAAASAALEKAGSGSGKESGDEMSVDLSDVEGSNVEAGASGLELQPKPIRKKRNYRMDEYDIEDDFVDDSEMQWENQAAASRDGFFVYSGPLVQEAEKAATAGTDGPPKRGRGSRGGRAGRAAGAGRGAGGGRGGAGTGPRGGSTRKPRITKLEKAQREREKAERESLARGNSLNILQPTTPSLPTSVV